MDRKYIVTRQGKDFVLYAGLLDLAHERGLRGIETDLIQVPTPENGHVAICRCRVTLVADGNESTFTGIADASIKNVAPAMQQCLIRMAETRAKARALRDAVNVGVAAVDEIPDDEIPDDHAPPPAARSHTDQRSAPPPRGAAAPTRATPAASAAPAPPPPSKGDGAQNAASDGQLRAIRTICGTHGWEIPEGIVNWSSVQASRWIAASNQRR